MRSSRSAFMPDEIRYPIAGANAGVLSGMTVAIKDMFDIAGTRTSGGSPAWRDAQKPAQAHAGAVRRVLDAGAQIVGKTICDEFFYSTVGANSHFGTPVNPHAPDRIPGGSSSGSAVAAAAGACDIAIGSDTGGSVRVPAALCGTYGIRVSRGRFDFAGAMSMAPSFDAGGWFATSPGVFRAAGRALLVGEPVPAPISRVVVVDDAMQTADDGIRRMAQTFLEATAQYLPAVEQATVSREGLEVWRETMRVVQAYEVWQTFGGFIRDKTPDLGPGIRERMQIASEVTKSQAEEARTVLDSATRQMDAATPVGTVLVLPTAPTVAPRLDESPEGLEDYRIRGMRLSCITSISGLPQVTIPIGALDGAPVGLSFIAWRGGDEALLDLAVRLSPFMGAATPTAKS